MSDQKILVVFGATGLQGGSVVNSILNDPKTAKEFKIRAITRDPTKGSAKALTARGVECVAANLDSKDEVKRALEEAYAVFAVTNYWEKSDAELEFHQGKNIADSAKECGVQHLIWSSLLNVTKLSGGEFSGVHHFDSKAKVEDYIKEIGVPATFYLPGFYMSNIPGGMFRPNPQSGDWTMALPMPADTPIPLFATGNDTGKFVKAILTHRDSTLGKQIYAATDYYTPTQMIEAFKSLYPEAGEKANFIQISENVFKGFLGNMPEPAQDEMYQNMAFMPVYGYYGKASLGDSHSILDEKLTTWKEFASGAEAFKGLK